MSKIGVRLKINVSMIEKARLFAGNKGKYLDATVFIDLDEKDQYGNSGMVTQDVSKEERDQNIRGPILGNVEIFYKENQSAQQPAAQGQQADVIEAPHGNAPPADGFDNFDEDPLIPF